MWGREGTGDVSHVENRCGGWELGFAAGALGLSGGGDCGMKMSMATV